MNADPLADYLCEWCTATSGALCDPCKALVASGACRGPRPVHAMPRAATPAACTVCRGERPGDGGTLRFCPTHTVGSRRRRTPDPRNDPPHDAPVSRGRALQSLYVKS